MRRSRHQRPDAPFGSEPETVRRPGPARIPKVPPGRLPPAFFSPPPPSPKKRKQSKKRRGVDACVGRLTRVKTVNRRAKPLKAAEEASGWRFFEILRHGGLSRHGRLGLPAFRRQRFSQAGPKTKSARGAPQSIGLTARLGAGGAKADLPPPKSLGLFPRARRQAQAARLRRAALWGRFWGAVSLCACSFFSPVLTFRRPPALLFSLLFASFSFFTFFTFFTFFSSFSFCFYLCFFFLCLAYFSFLLSFLLALTARLAFFLRPFYEWLGSLPIALRFPDAPADRLQGGRRKGALRQNARRWARRRRPKLPVAPRPARLRLVSRNKRRR